MNARIFVPHGFARWLARRERELYAAYLRGKSLTALAREYDMTERAVARVVKREGRRLAAARAANPGVVVQLHAVRRGSALTLAGRRSVRQFLAALHGRASDALRTDFQTASQTGIRVAAASLRAALAIRLDRFRRSSGTSVGMAALGGTAQPTSGGSAPPEARP